MYNPKAKSRARYWQKMSESILKIYQVKQIYLLLLNDIKAELEKFISKLENVKSDTGYTNRSRYQRILELKN